MNREKVVEIVKSLAEIEWPHTTMTLDTAVNSVGLDSLDKVEFIMSLEKEFDLDIADEESEKLATLQHVVDYICDRLGVRE